MYKTTAQIVQTVLEKIAVEEEKPKGGVPWWLPLAAGGGMALGGYGLSRIPFKASLKKYPALRRIQDMAKGKMLRTDAVEYQGLDYATLSKGEKVKRLMKYGPEIDEADVAKHLAQQKDKAPAAVWQGSEMPASGTFNPALGGSTSQKQVGKAYDIVDELEDKLFEAQLLQKYAPGTSARSLGMEDVAAKYGIKLRKGKNLPEDLKSLQNALKKEFGEGYMIKTRAGRIGGDPGIASSGVFPTEATDLARAHEQWKAMRPEYLAAAKGAPNVNELIKQFRTREGYEGRIVDELLHNNVVFQERLPLVQHGKAIAARMKAKGYAPTQEYRVHAVGGRAVPSMAMPRYPALHPRALVDMYKARRAAKWTQKNVLDRLPAEYRDISYGMDIAPIRGGGYKVVETNPGGMSGLLDNPIGAHGLHKAVTGRYSKPVAAGIGAAAGTVGVGGGLLAQRLAQPEQRA